MTDLAWLLFRHGYDAVVKDRRARGAERTDDYESRLLGRRAVVVRSNAGARAFYDESLVRRKGAVPPPLAWLLFGRGAVHGLDAPEHRERKAMFLDVLDPGALPSLADKVDAELRAQVATWPGREVEVYDELVLAFGRAVLRWAGVPVADDEAQEHSRRLGQVVDGFGFAGRAYARGWRARIASNRWARGLVEDVRAGRVQPPCGTVLEGVARSDLSPHVAGVELLNVLRPTVAVAWLGTFAALRFAEHTDWRERLVDLDGAADRLSFAQEVRRTTPFVPVLAGRARRHEPAGGVEVRSGGFLVLDVLGIDHDHQRWPEPDRFDPARFLAATPDAFDLVPQGGGLPTTGHRCPGESVVLLLLDVTLKVLPLLDYSVIDAHVDRSRMPTLPRDGLRIRVASSAHNATT